jgi:hypothetical protein
VSDEEQPQKEKGKHKKATTQKKKASTQAALANPPATATTAPAPKPEAHSVEAILARSLTEEIEEVFGPTSLPTTTTSHRRGISEVTPRDEREIHEEYAQAASEHLGIVTANSGARRSTRARRTRKLPN